MVLEVEKDQVEVAEKDLAVNNNSMKIAVAVVKPDNISEESKNDFDGLYVFKAILPSY